MNSYAVEEAIRFVEENDVKFIRLAFCDIFGSQKNISIMPQELREAFEMGILFDSFQVLGYSDPVYQNLYLKPDPGTMSILPWRPSSGRVIRFYCDVVTPDGEVYHYDTRKFLKDTLQECADMGFSCRIGLKSEFYLFKTDEDGAATNIPWDEGGYLDIAPFDRGENIRREICLCLEEMGIQPESSHHEAGPGQNEIDFRASDALGTADNFITYKNVVGAIAARNGIFASFAPKPLRGKSGNGLHMKISTWKNGVNIEDIDPKFTESFTAGVLNRMKDITLFLNTQVESYERFGENEAPKYITWSAQARSRLLRIPVVNGKRTCFELRSPDSGINPYLAFAMVIQAGLAGVRGKEELPPPVDVSMGSSKPRDKKNYEKLPENLQDAVEYAKQSEFLSSTNCKDMAEHFINILEENRL